MNILMDGLFRSQCPKGNIVPFKESCFLSSTAPSKLSGLLVFPELRCTFGGRSTVPDIVVFTGDRIPRDENGEIANAFNIAPDWTIEILSPSQNQTKVTKNILHYLKHGTQMGWLIDPGEQTVLVYRPRQEIEVFDESEAMLPMPSLASELMLTVENLFSWLFE